MSRSRKERQPSYRNRRRGGPGERRRMAIIFALALGWIGTHRFILGQWQWGLLHIFLFIASMAITDGGLSPWMTASAFLAYYHAYRWYKMSDEDFGERFLERTDGAVAAEIKGRYLQGKEVTHPRVLSSRARRQLLASAKTAFESFDYQAAADRYEQALDLDLNDGESRVLAARCYSLLENADAAYRHLARAAAVRADNLALVQTDPDFAWLRTQADFEFRRGQGFQLVGDPAQAAQTLEHYGPARSRTERPRYPSSSASSSASSSVSSSASRAEVRPDGATRTAETGATHAAAAPSAPHSGALPSPSQNLLDDLERLAQLRDRGILNEVEFLREKERLLRK